MNLPNLKEESGIEQPDSVSTESTVKKMKRITKYDIYRIKRVIKRVYEIPDEVFNNFVEKEHIDVEDMFVEDSPYYSTPPEAEEFRDYFYDYLVEENEDNDCYEWQTDIELDGDDEDEQGRR